MKEQVFDEKIKPLMDLIHQICKEEGIEFLTEFKIDKGWTYLDKTDDMRLSPDLIFSQYTMYESHKEALDKIEKEKQLEKDRKDTLKAIGECNTNKDSNIVLNIIVSSENIEKSVGTLANEIFKHIMKMDSRKSL